MQEAVITLPFSVLQNFPTASISETNQTTFLKDITIDLHGSESEGMITKCINMLRYGKRKPKCRKCCHDRLGRLQELESMSTANCDQFIVNRRLRKGLAITLNQTILKQNMAD